MTVAENKRRWFLARRTELHERGLKDAAIAEQMGLKRAYFSQVVNGANVGDGFVDRMCQAFGFSYPTPNPVALKANAGMVNVDAKQFGELVDQVKLQTRLLNAVLDRLEKESK